MPLDDPKLPDTTCEIALDAAVAGREDFADGAPRSTREIDPNRGILPRRCGSGSMADRRGSRAG
jgi:hypothetical protein